ncbi:hypothetical protein EHM92_06830 [bacterium]|nr:MAG: hypothetical protein EHM92_06830 [bacterium]
MPEIPYDVLVKEASRQMLAKDRPEGREDWVKVINFIAWNVDFRSCLQVCYTIARLNNVPLRQREIEEIVDFQTYDRAARELALQERTAALLSDAAIRDVNEFFGGRF